ncbi:MULTISPECIES: glycosyltransferase family A protein [unclassified Actinotalea]|uniref:glycosyltransferase family 2 protein n=1 Tax=unclassified Actinotalea TaxID=2638618 RepID=UPI0015F3806A|nr:MULTISPECIES: glycosyltransferase family A protein [unclassified Actinotalea]
MTLAVVVPAFQEATGIGATLAALRDQRDADFDVVVVDNGSTDGTPDVVRAFVERWGLARWRVLHEPLKGTGAAADTGMRAAIAAGATLLARTDADCLPAPGWTRAVRTALTDGGLELVTGPMLPRSDDVPVGPLRRGALRAAVAVAARFGQIRPGNQDPAYLGPYLMCPGCNLAITADLYERAGGFPRTAIEDLHEDRALVNAVRRLTPRYGYRRDVVVRASVRRVHAWGLRRTLGWYADHRYRPAVVDIR